MDIKRLFGLIFGVNGILLCMLVVIALFMLQNETYLSKEQQKRYQSYLAADALRQSSQDLTRLARTYVSTGEKKYEDMYWDVIAMRNGKKTRPDGTCISLNQIMKDLGFTDTEFAKLKLAADKSDGLVWIETVAMNAVKGKFADKNKQFTIEREPDFALARNLMFNEVYHQYVKEIMSPIDEFFVMLDKRTKNEVLTVEEHGQNLLYVFFFIIVTLLLICFVSYLTIRKKLIELDSSQKELKEKHSQLSHQFDDLQNTQTQLIEAEKQAALGKLVAGVAHEVNTPIGIALSYTSFLRDQVNKIWADYQKGLFKRSAFEKLCSTLTESLTSSEESLTRAATLIRSFKQTAADQSVESLRNFEINEYIAQSLLSLKIILKNTPHKIDFNSTEEIMVNSYPGAITQILTNLINNSTIHGYDDEQAGMLTLSTKYDEERQLVVMVYADDGKGMDEDVLSKMYNPFFTTNMGSGGTGLGMHIIYNLIRQTLQGTIECESIPGQGTKFIITIPKNSK